MTPVDFNEIARLKTLTVPRALAFVPDRSRRGAVRVARVAVLENWPALAAAQVAEMKTGTHHVLPHSRLARLAAPAGVKKQRLRATLT